VNNLKLFLKIRSDFKDQKVSMGRIIRSLNDSEALNAGNNVLQLFPYVAVLDIQFDGNNVLRHITPSLAG